MPLFAAKRVYDRRRILDEAARAGNRNKRRRAIALYRWALAVEPNNPGLHSRLAPLLADTGQRFDAWRCYRTMAQAALREGRKDKALAIYRDATNRLPRELQAWEGLAHLLAVEGDAEEAIRTLIEGSRRFAKRAHRPEAIHLLRRARGIDPWHFEAVFELARRLASGCAACARRNSVWTAPSSQRGAGSEPRCGPGRGPRRPPERATSCRCTRALTADRRVAGPSARRPAGCGAQSTSSEAGGAGTDSAAL